MGTDDHCFLGATLRDTTSQSIRHHNKQSFIKRIDDVKAVSVQYTRAIVSLDSFLLQGTWFNYNFDIYLLISSSAQIWPLES